VVFYLISAAEQFPTFFVFFLILVKHPDTT
jgi:hypothetical protein